MSLASVLPSDRRRRVALTAVLAVGALLAGSCSSDGSDGSAAGTTTTVAATVTTAGPSTTGATTSTTKPAEGTGGDAPAAVGTYPVGVRTLKLVDGSHSTQAYAGQPELPTRALPTLVVYPAAGTAAPLDPKNNPEEQKDAAPRAGRYPLLLMSHGVGARNIAYEVQMATWASAGYVVVAPDHPLANSDTVGGSMVGDLPNQPADLSFLIDVFTGKAKTGESVGDAVPADLLGAVDGERVGAVGHSLGAATVLGLGYGECCADDRVDAVVSWAGLEAIAQVQAPGSTDRPLLLVHGTKDGTVPYSQSERMMRDLNTPRWFITLIDGNHVSPFLSPHVSDAAAVVTGSALDFFDAWVKDDPTGISRMETLVADAGTDVATLVHQPAT